MSIYPEPSDEGPLFRTMLSVATIAVFLLIALSLCGCSREPFWPTAASSGTPQEEWVLAETVRFARLLRVDVTGVLTDKAYVVQPGVYTDHAVKAAGWYEAGIAYYYRPWVVTSTLEQLTNVAAHEVCHAKSSLHDKVHQDCMRSVGQEPGYSVN